MQECAKASHKLIEFFVFFVVSHHFIVCRRLITVISFRRLSTILVRNFFFTISPNGQHWPQPSTDTERLRKRFFPQHLIIIYYLRGIDEYIECNSYFVWYSLFNILHKFVLKKKNTWRFLFLIFHTHLLSSF